MHLFSVLFPCVSVVLAVGWFTLVERNVLGYLIGRKGPNNVGSLGLMQPVADGLKLFSNSVVAPACSNYAVFFLAPCLALCLSICLWLSYPFSSSLPLLSLGVLFFLAVSSVSVFPVLLAGWGSNSKYALVGAVRGVAQSVSYEISLAVVFVCYVCLSQSLCLKEVALFQHAGVVYMNILVGSCLCGVWLMSILAETNRAPFDFVEGESELVSGFNVEYGGGMFAILYISENVSILFNGVLTSVVFLGGSDIVTSIVASFFFFFFVWIRGSMPRLRYDSLMEVVWKSVLPMGLSVLIVVFGLELSLISLS